MTETTEIPEVTAYMRPIHERGRIVNYQLYVICPYCGEYHYHGLGSDRKPAPGTNLGHRAADCGGNHGYYVIVD